MVLARIPLDSNLDNDNKDCWSLTLPGCSMCRILIPKKQYKNYP